MADQDQTETYHGYSVDAENQPQTGGVSNIDDRGLAEPLDEGYSPPERWSPAQRFGTTAREESDGESLDQRLAQEELELDPRAEAARLSAAEDVGGEVGGERSGRLVADADVRFVDAPAAMQARDVGVDGAGASAEEAAMHLIEEEQQ